MGLDNAITNRRSIRRYKPDKVSKEQIDAILDAGNKAPSAKNLQQWRFFVYTGDAKDKLVDYCLLEFDKINTDPDEVNPYARNSFEIMNDAPVSILVFNVEQMLHPSRPDIQSISAAIQNMLLKAYDLGLGSVWICDILYIDKKVQEYVKTGMKLIAAISIGYANHSPKDRRKLTVEDVTKWFE
ncbi:MAG: nitroreductase family protein [Asgard group archaeon]|nr:nitroreductase family protein [Asgard group archaeon]